MVGSVTTTCELHELKPLAYRSESTNLPLFTLYCFPVPSCCEWSGSHLRPLLRQGGTTRSRILEADFSGVVAGVTARQLCLLPERLGPSYPGGDNGLQSSIASQSSNEPKPVNRRVTWSRLGTSPPFPGGVLPFCFLETFPPPMDYLTLLSVG